MSCVVGHRCGLNLALLWLWCRPVAIAPIWPLAWEPPYAKGAALKRQKKRKEKVQHRYYRANIKVHRAVFLSRGSVDEFSSRLVQALGRIHFLVVLGLRSHFAWWLSDSGWSLLLEAAHISSRALCEILFLGLVLGPLHLSARTHAPALSLKVSDFSFRPISLSSTASLSTWSTFSALKAHGDELGLTWVTQYLSITCLPE